MTNKLKNFFQKIFYIADEIAYLENTLKEYNFYSAKIYFSFKDNDIIGDIKKGLEKR